MLDPWKKRKSASHTAPSPVASSSKTPSDSGRPKKKVKRQPVEDDGIYIVETIMARSLYRGWGPNGLLEYQYLIRWEGYGPEDDTWEMRSTLMDGSASLVTEFDALEHPFTILKSQGLNPRKYLVEFGHGPPDYERSPLAQQLWQTVAQLKARQFLLPGTIDRIVKSFHQGQHSVAIPSPKKTPISPRRPLKAPKKAEPELFLVEILQQSYQRMKSATQKSLYWRIRVQRGNEYLEEWVKKAWCVSKFGKQATDLAVKRFQGFVEHKEQSPPVLSEYEVERLKNIEKNREMMKELGLGLQ